MSPYGHAPRARVSDPDTSHAAAASVEASPVLRQRQQAVLVLYRNAPNGLTDHEAALAYARWREAVHLVPEQSPSGLRTRRSELTAMGLVLDTGERRRLPSGRQGIVWAARAGYNPPKEHHP